MLIRVQHKYLVFGRPVKVTEKGTPINFGAEDAYRTTARRSQHATDSYIVFLLFLIVIVVLQPDNNRYKRWYHGLDGDRGTDSSLVSKLINIKRVPINIRSITRVQSPNVGDTSILIGTNIK